MWLADKHLILSWLLFDGWENAKASAVAEASLLLLLIQYMGLTITAMPGCVQFTYWLVKERVPGAKARVSLVLYCPD
jgi:hypothetical protein